jgi:ribonuclease BN (tRNA processing enzyme)
MRLVILGSGTCVPSLKRSSPSNYLHIDGKQVLIDCGPGTLLQLEKAGLDYKGIDIICISHYHPDHISDLNALIQALNCTPGFNRKKDLFFIGPVGFKNFYELYIKPISGGPRPNTYRIFIKEISKRIKINHFTIESCKTNHNAESIAYKFIEEEKSLVISGDTDFDSNLIEFAKNSDILILECSYPNNQKVSGHLIPKECGEIAKRANVKKLILSHLYPVVHGEKRGSETKEVFQNTVLAEDLMNFYI